MVKQLGLGLAVLVFAATALAEQSQDFSGWQGIRVIEQEGGPWYVRAADLEGDGRQELVVVNRQQSRLEIVRWLPPEEPPEERHELPAADPKRPNELPMAMDLERQEVLLERLPSDVLAADIDGDGQCELAVLVTSPNRLLIFKESAEDGWKEINRWDLLEGKFAGRSGMMVIRDHVAEEEGENGEERGESREGKEKEVLIGCDQGLQALVLREGARATWLRPVDKTERVAFWLADLDGDGEKDLLEWTRKSQQTLRWCPGEKGRLLPAIPLDDQNFDDVNVLTMPTGKAEILALGGVQTGMLRRSVLEKGEANPLGASLPLPLAGGSGGGVLWVGAELEGKPAVVVVDSLQPRLLVYRLEGSVMSAEMSFPSVAEVEAIATAKAAGGSVIILKAKDAGDVHVSRWEGSRFSYPQILPRSGEVEDRRILALEMAGATAWWVQRVGSDLDLYTWGPGAAEPAVVRFKDVGAKVDKARWVGGESLLILDQYARTPKLVRRENEKTVVSEPTHLKKAALEQYQLLPWGGQLRLGRQSEGVLQWLDKDLQPMDQVMLPEGQALLAFVPAAEGEGGALPGAGKTYPPAKPGDETKAVGEGKAGEAHSTSGGPEDAVWHPAETQGAFSGAGTLPGGWALQQGGQFIHRMELDEAGVLRVTQSIHLAIGGTGLKQDPELGLVLLSEDRLFMLRPGAPLELKTLETIDSRLGRPSGVREATFHRMFATDVTGDGRDEVVLTDDKRHQLTVLTSTGEKLEPVISWQVYEDKAYPYGRHDDELVPEPRRVLGLDLDGDGRQDLAMLCHDRLVIYLGRDEKKAHAEGGKSQ
ncbi:MAG: hypothetical protein IT443_07585 [Phycisphaeraceae bacterium]|nr:hypothetical protein [Phycisphaeraceae bacterium]